MMAAVPEMYFFPRMLLVTGPLHICWNAYKTVIQASTLWEKLLDCLREFLAFLGNRGLRQRFLATCIQ